MQSVFFILVFVTDTCLLARVLRGSPVILHP